MSCIIVALHVPVYCAKKIVVIRPYKTDFEIHHMHVLRHIGMVIFSYAIRYWKRIVLVKKNPKKIQWYQAWVGVQGYP